MWVFTLCYATLLITSSMCNPLKNDETDGFFAALRSALEKLLVSRTPAEPPIEEDPVQNYYRETNAYEEVMEPKKFGPVVEHSDSFHAAMLPEIRHDVSPGLNPLYQCDTFEVSSRTCTNIRQIGTTLTLGIRMDNRDKPSQFQKIRWYRYFKRLGSLSDVHEEFTRDNLPWNINIGGESNELRISPITEIDFSFNYFVATVNNLAEKKEKGSPNLQLIKFIIEPISIDMGILYPGEELVIYSRAFMELPMNSVTFRWTLNNSEFGLPSNMKVKEDGSSVVVKELRTSIDKVLTCSVYSNKNVFLAKRSFLFRKIASQNFLGGNFEQENPYFSPHSPPFRKKRSLNEIEGFVDDEDLERPRLYHTKNYGASEFNYQNKIDHHNNDRDTQDEFLNNADDWYSPYPKPETSDIKMKNFQLRKTNSYRFFKPDSLDNFPLRDETVEESDPEFSNEVDPFRYQSNREKLSIMNRDFKKEYQNDQGNKYNSRPKKDLNRLPFENEAGNQDQRSKTDPNRLSFEKEGRNQDQGDQIDDLIQQANLLAQKTTEKNLKKVNAVNLNNNQRLSFDDEESSLLSNCKDNNDCSVHATCFKKSIGHYFCRCFPQYKGNGIFCWLV